MSENNKKRVSAFIRHGTNEQLKAVIKRLKEIGNPHANKTNIVQLALEHYLDKLTKEMPSLKDLNCVWRLK